MAARFSEELKAIDHSTLSHVIILGGTNDLGEFDSDITIKNLQTMWSEARATEAQLICITLPDGGVVLESYISPLFKFVIIKCLFSLAGKILQ